MLCYKDKTFCSVKCDELKCSRNLTEEVRKAAREWWGSDNAPIAVADLSNCGMYKKPKD